MQTLITPSEISELARPISGKIDDARVISYIAEAQQVKIKKAVGADLLLSLMQDGELSAADKLLLSGGEYQANGTKYYARGLKVALAYFAYAKLVINNPVNVTRFGTRTMSDEKSQSIDWKQLTAIASDAESYGDDCLLEVLELLNARSSDYPLFQSSVSQPVRGRTIIFAVGQ